MIRELHIQGLYVFISFVKKAVAITYSNNRQRKRYHKIIHKCALRTKKKHRRGRIFSLRGCMEYLFELWSMPRQRKTWNYICHLTMLIDNLKETKPGNIINFISKLSFFLQRFNPWANKRTIFPAQDHGSRWNLLIILCHGFKSFK